MEGYEEGIFSKPLDWKTLFLLTMKKKNKTSYPNEEYNSVFEYIHQVIRAYPRSRKVCIDQCSWKPYCILARIRAKGGVGKQVWFAPNTLRGGEGAEVWSHPRKSLQFLLLFNTVLDTVFPSPSTKNVYIYMNIYFSRKMVIVSKS